MEGVLLRTSCDACTASKVKCSGGEQCKRCQGKGVACFYSPRKKRGPPKKRTREKKLEPEVLAMDAKGDPTSALNALGVHEKRSWSVFFSLYKHFNTSCSRVWFNRQLNKMRSYLERQSNTDALKRLTAWMEALNIDLDEMMAGMQRCMLSIRKSALENARREAHENALDAQTDNNDVWNSAERQPTSFVPALHITGELRELQMTDQSEVQNLVTESEDNASLPFLKITTDLDGSDMDAEVHVNDAFTRLFGYTNFNIEAQLRVTGGGFLPWGGDVLSRLLTTESDLLAYVQVMAIKFNNLGRPRVLPTVREVPSCHKFRVTIAQEGGSDDDSDDTEADAIELNELQQAQHEQRQRRKAAKELESKTVDCLIKCVHREVLAMDRSYTEMFFTFHPLHNERIQRPFVPVLSLRREATIKRKLDEMLPNFPSSPAPPHEIAAPKRQHRHDGSQQAHRQRQQQGHSPQQQHQLQQPQQVERQSSLVYMGDMDDPFGFGSGDNAEADLNVRGVLGGAIEQDDGVVILEGAAGTGGGGQHKVEYVFVGGEKEVEVPRGGGGRQTGGSSSNNSPEPLTPETLPATPIVTSSYPQTISNDVSVASEGGRGGEQQKTLWNTWSVASGGGGGTGAHQGDNNINNNNKNDAPPTEIYDKLWMGERPVGGDGDEYGGGVMGMGALPLADSESDDQMTQGEEAGFMQDDIDGAWLDSLLDWVKAE